MRVAVALVVLAAAAGIARAAPEPTTQAKADVLFEKGRADYDAGQYQAAIELFKQAYQLVHDPVYLFNIAQSYRKVLDCEQAFDYYSRYLSESPDASNKAMVQRWLTEIEPCVEQRRQEREAARRGEEAEKARQAELQRRQHPAVAHETEVDGGGSLRLAGIITGGVGVAGLAVAVGFSVHGANLKEEIAQHCGGMASCNWDMWKSKDAAGKEANTIAAVAYIGGGVAVLAGAALYMFGHTRVEHVVVMPIDHGASVGAWLRF
jgi:tetratricopeptide (TPR) repeat protein